MLQIIECTEIPIYKQTSQATITFHRIEGHTLFCLQHGSQLCQIAAFFFRERFLIQLH